MIARVIMIVKKADKPPEHPGPMRMVEVFFVRVFFALGAGASAK
jgi:hypothetical protein